MKKILAMILLCAMLVVGTTVNVCAANGDVTLKCADVVADKGETVEVALTIEENAGFCGLNVFFTYSEELELVSVTNAVPSLSFMYSRTAVWDGASNYFETGELAVLTFKVPDDAADGTKYDVNVHFIEAFDFDGNDVTATTQSGSITVGSSHTCEYKVNTNGVLSTGTCECGKQSNEAYAGFIQFAETNASLARIIFVIDGDELNNKELGYDNFDLTITANGKSYTVNSDDLAAYTQVTAAGATFTAENGDQIFGMVVDFGETVPTGISVSLTAGAKVLYSGAYVA